MAFIDSTIAPSTADHLATMLKNRDSSEAESVLELLFFPDEAFQIQLEPLLQRRPVIQTDLTDFIAHLGRYRLRTHLVLPDHRGTLDLEMPASVVATFVTRLNITRRLPRRLIQVIQESVPSHETDKIKVMLRNHRTLFTDDQVRFLDTFFKQMPTTGQPLGPHLAMVLQVFGETAGHVPVYQALTEKKRNLMRHLQAAMAFEQKRRRHAMETLMLGGERAAHIHPEDALRTISCIDTVTLAVFGTVGGMDIGPLQHAFEQGDADDKLTAIMRIFD